MRLNKLGFLSLLAILGILGFTINRSFLGFFGFAYYIRYFFVTPDEMFQHNVRRAASVGFFSGVAATGLAIPIHLLLPELLSAKMALASGYIVSVFCFTIVLAVLEFRELRGC